MKIPSARPYFSDKDIEFILAHFKEILEGKSFLTQFKYCEEFEEKFARYHNSEYAVTTSNGTASLEIIFRAIGIRGFDVIVTTNTFAATIFAIIHAGGKPVFADCTNDMTLDPNEVRRKLTHKTKAVVTVHIGGLVSPHTKEIVEICEDNDLYLVEDAAHAHGSMLDDKYAGTFGFAGAFSFFSTKVMTTGEGGMITTNDGQLYEKAKLLRNQAKEQNENYHKTLGHNWRMTEIQALMGLTQLKMLDDFISKRIHLKKIYDEELDKIPELTPLVIPKNCRHNLYKYIVFTPDNWSPQDRDNLKQKLRKEFNVNLGGYVYELPCHLQPVFKDYVQESLPMAEHLCNHHICPPMYHEMTDEEASYVINSIRKCIK